MKKFGVFLLLIFLLAVILQQWAAYLQLRNAVGQYAYANVGYGLRIVGQEGEFVGKIIDLRWNQMPDRVSDVEGYQPRYLIARETVSDVTETLWFCTYLFDVKDVPPATYTPKPFPLFERKESIN